MTHSGKQILTTHVGSLPRGEVLSTLLMERESGASFDRGKFDAAIADAVHDAVKRQVGVGIDIVSDGEMSKITYATYVKDRLTGFDGDTPRQPARDLADHLQYAARMAAFAGEQKFKRQSCVGPVSYVGYADLQGDLDHLRAAADRIRPHGCFLNAASPGLVSAFQPNAYYPTQEEYLEAIGEAMQVEYEAIIAAGFMLQVDCPDLAMARHTGFQNLTDEEFLNRAAHAVEVLNHSLRNIAPHHLRMHVCWGNYEGPHDHDIALDKILPIVLKARPSTVLFEASNPRHAHEWATWKAATIPDDKILAPGVITSTSNYVEHPELVAQRIEQFVDIVGPDRVIAGSDCGFGTFAGIGKIDGDIAYKKLAALVDGAQLASKRMRTGAPRGHAQRVDTTASEDECERLVIQSALLNDAKEWEALASLYTPDGLLTRPNGDTVVGREAIAAAYSGGPSNRTTRHLCSNWICTVESDYEARGVTTVLLYSSIPNNDAGTTTSTSVGEFSDRFVRTENGWRIAARSASITIRS